MTVSLGVYKGRSKHYIKVGGGEYIGRRNAYDASE